MAWNNYYGYYEVPPWYVTNPEPAFVRDGLPYYEAVPVAFREPPFYDDTFIQDFRHHHPDLGRPGFIPGEQILVRRPDDETYREAGPYWRNPGYPFYGGYPVFIPRRPENEEDESEQVIEYYVPLCCENCVGRVTEYLIELPGVDNVTADQWEKRVVVMGRDLRPHELLRSLQRYLEMPRSAFWEHRPR